MSAALHAAEAHVELAGAAVLGEGTVDEVGVDDDLVAELFGQAVEPLALHRRPRGNVVDARHGLGDALLEGNERLAERGLADVADDAGGEINSRCSEISGR